MRQDGSDDGLRPPADQMWQLGKTAAAIRFVKHAEAYLTEEEHDIPQRRLDELRDAVESLKTGEKTLSRFITVEDFLKGDCLDDD